MIHEPANPESTQLMTTIAQLVTTMANDREARQPAEGRGCTLNDLCSHNSDNFDGSVDNFSADRELAE